MERSWTFGQKIGAGMAACVGFAVLIAGIAVYALQSVVEVKDRVITVHAQNLIDAGKLHAATEGKVAAIRGYLLDPQDSFLANIRDRQAEFNEALDRMRAQSASPILSRIDSLDKDHQLAADKLIASRKSETSIEKVARQFEDELVPRREALRRETTSFIAQEQKLLEAEKKAASDTAGSAITALVGAGIVTLLLAAFVAFGLTRLLTRQIGSAVQHIQSSSAELQSASNQQATGAKEQATAMAEITTTINELLATSRQIAESAQRVAQISEQTASNARGGDQTVTRGQESISTIKRQVDLIVTHMLDLGKKSQQVGGILEIINELAEQTNILAINASIEAAGAGEAGKRFAVVADEIRKLADRVGGSTKEIRVLIDETRAAVNTTVMTTEAGAKAVEAGARQFSDIATAFRQIADLIRTTTEAGREIELSTKQQATAVQQVNQAITDVAQTTRESEASTSQTLQTATQLTQLSRELSRFVQPQSVG